MKVGDKLEREKRRYTFSSIDKSLPLFVESIGYNPEETTFSRPDGYPYFHWLQTLEGAGNFYYGGDRNLLTPGKGILIAPFTPHSYAREGTEWKTLYVTFGGSLVEQILDSLEINLPAFYSETEQLPFSSFIEEMLIKVKRESEFSRLDSSGDLYRFLIILKKYGKINNQQSLSHYYEKVRPVVNWLENKYSENIGLPEMAAQADMSSQYLNALFQETFGMSPYSFLIQLRIREAKKILVTKQDTPLKQVASLVGFNDVSHFVATFRKIEGITPKKYRDLYNAK
jgi:AraC family transcriptional regulator, arabinose operon regulatory protein